MCVCSKCDDRGYIETAYETFVSSANSKYKDQNFMWRDEACQCELGQEWLQRRIRIDMAMASRMNEFIDKYYKVKRISHSRRFYTRNELADVYLGGRREWLDNPRAWGWDEYKEDDNE
jgi:hypothetical protein